MRDLLLKFSIVFLFQVIFSNPSLMSFAQEIGDEDIKMESVDENDVVALYNLGIRHFRGIDVPKDEEEAVKWFQKAALQGHAGAQFAIGCCCLRGIGIPKNAEEAVSWYKKAAEQEHANAQFYLASCYYRGIGIPKNGEESFMWFQKAVKQNKKFLSSEPLFSILNAVQKRPIVITPKQSFRKGYICSWDRKPLTYKSDAEALSAANNAERQKYYNAVAKYDFWVQLPEKEKDAMILKELAPQDIQVVKGKKYYIWAQVPEKEKQEMISHARSYGGHSFHQIVQWRLDMDTKFDGKYPYPMSDLIFVEGLPKDTLTNVSIDTVIYYMGTTINYDGLVIQHYTVNFQDALAISMKKN
jgi:hypothetical protein